MRGFRNVGALAGLVSLRLAYIDISDAALANLVKLTNLERLDLTAPISAMKA